jgi:hypothetical protein
MGVGAQQSGAQHALSLHPREQMRHWFEAGYFNADRLLVKNAEEIGPGFVPLRSAYPDDDSAFIPRNRAAIVTAPGSHRGA